MIRLPWRVRAERERAQREADEALAASQADLRRTQARGHDVSRVANRLRKLQHDNHFAETILTIYGGKT